MTKTRRISKKVLTIIILTLLFIITTIVTITYAKSFSVDDTSLIETTDKLLGANLKNNKNITIYFYGNNRLACIEAKPNIIRYSKMHKTAIRKFNTDIEDYGDYNLNGVPTTIHYKDGVEHSRLEGSTSKLNTYNFFREIKQLYK